MASIDSRAECRRREVKTGKKRESIAAKICAAHAGARAESLTARNNKTGPDRSLFAASGASPSHPLLPPRSLYLQLNYSPRMNPKLH